MGDTVRFRSTTSKIVGVAAMGFSVFGLVALSLTGRWELLPSYGVVLAAVGLVGYATMWAPYVEVNDGFVELNNVLRNIRLPWPSIEKVDGRYGLRLQTAYGRYAAWAAPAPAGRDRLRGLDSEAAGLVRQRIDELRRAGHLDAPRLEAERPAVAWHWTVIAAAALLAGVALMGIVAG